MSPQITELFNIQIINCEFSIWKTDFKSIISKVSWVMDHLNTSLVRYSDRDSDFHFQLLCL